VAGGITPLLRCLACPGLSFSGVEGTSVLLLSLGPVPGPEMKALPPLEPDFATAIDAAIAIACGFSYPPLGIFAIVVLLVLEC
jgi:hypothetical protein